MSQMVGKDSLSLYLAITLYTSILIFDSALSPTAPFPKQTPRLKLASLLVPAVLVAAFTTSYMFMKMTMLFTGLGFFGDPVVWRAIDLLNTKFPNWQKLLELRK